MTREEFIKEAKAEKDQYVMGIGAYYDALIEHDFDKACKLLSKLVYIMKPEIQAYVAKQMYESSSYEELEETYKNAVNDVRNELDKDTGD